MANESLQTNMPDGIEIAHQLEGHEADVRRMAWSPDGTKLASPSDDGSIRLWYPQNDGGILHKVLRGHDGQVSGCTWSPDSSKLGSCSDDGSVFIWHKDDDKDPKRFPLAMRMPTCIDWHPREMLVAVGCQATNLALLDLSGEGTLVPPIEKAKEQRNVSALAWSPRGDMLAAGSSNGTFAFWDKSGKWLDGQKGHEGAVLCVAWSRDGSMLATGAQDGRFLLWRPGESKPFHALNGDGGVVKAATFSADRRLMAAYTSNGATLIYRTSDWESVARIHAKPTGRNLVGIGFNPKQPLLATLGDEGKTIVLAKFSADLLSGNQLADGATEKASEAEAPPPEVGDPVSDEKSEVDESEATGFGNALSMGDAISEKDGLDREWLNRCLASMVAHPEQDTPITIGLFGLWGTGKSTFLSHLKERLASVKEPRFLFGEFNAWKYEHTDSIPAGLAQETMSGLVGPPAWYSLPTLLGFRYALATFGLHFVLKLMLFLGLVCTTGYHVFDGIAAWWSGDSYAEVVGGVSVAGWASASAVAVATVLIARHVSRLIQHPVFAQLQTYLRLPEYGQHLGLLPVLSRDVRTMCRLRGVGKDSRLLVVVDDLDRCRPQCVMRTLEAIRLVMDIPGTVVIVAVDPDVVLHAVEQQFKHMPPHRALAREHVAKIIQVPVWLKEPSPEITSSYIRSELFSATIETQTTSDAEMSERTGADTASQSEDPMAAEGETSGSGDLRPPPSDEPSTPEMEPTEAVHGSNVDAQTPGRSPRSPQSVDLDKLMADTSHEATEFAELARGMEINNPRRLKRLRNTYRLAKLVDSAASGGRSWRKIMVMLFVRDLLGELSPDQATSAEKALKHGDDKMAKGIRQLPEQRLDFIVKKLRKVGLADPLHFEQYRRVARDFSLPMQEAAAPEVGHPQD